MPIYEYQCQVCSRVHEELQKFSDPALTECPSCHGELKKIMSLSGFALKGAGWYATDYKKTSVSPPSPATAATSGKEAAPAASSSAATDATPAAPAPKTESAPAASASK